MLMGECLKQATEYNKRIDFMASLSDWMSSVHIFTSMTGWIWPMSEQSVSPLPLTASCWHTAGFIVAKTHWLCPINTDRFNHTHTNTPLNKQDPINMVNSDTEDYLLLSLTLQLPAYIWLFKNRIHFYKCMHICINVMYCSCIVR